MSQNGTNMKPISPTLSENEQFFKERVGLGDSFDLGMRKIHILNREINIYYVNGLCDTQFIIEIMESLLHLNEVERKS